MKVKEPYVWKEHIFDNTEIIWKNGGNINVLSVFSKKKKEKKAFMFKLEKSGSGPLCLNLKILKFLGIL